MLNRVSSKYCFIDVEASGLMAGSFPVDIGWSLHGAVRSVMVKPADHWNSDKWDPAAQSIHGFHLSFVRRNGRDVRSVARVLNDELRGSAVYSDSFARDAEWVDMVFHAAGAKREFEIRSVGPLLSSLGISSDLAYAAFSEARESKPSAGPAVMGVGHLQEVFDILQTKGHLHP